MKRTQGKGKHGLLTDGARPPEYAIWKTLIQRCHNPDCPEFKNYGSCGTRVADRWRETDGFANFLADVGRQPFAGAGLHLRDPPGHFEPGNVEWANTRVKHLLTHEGRTMSLAEWAVELKMNERTLRGRVRLGWSDTATLTRYPAYRDHLDEYRLQKRKKTENTNFMVTM
jgi:hypothetical protein